MSEDLLASFRADVPLPDTATADRIRARATSPRLTRRAPRARLALAAGLAAVIGGALAAVVLTGTLGEGTTSTRPSVVVGGQAPYRDVTWDFTASGHTFTSIAVTIHAQIRHATVQLRIVRSEATQVPQAYNAASQVVFKAQEPMTDLESPAADGTLSAWSGTLSPSDWAGGCKEALYRIETEVFPPGSSTATEGDSSAWFQCTGPDVDASNPFPNHFSN